MFEDLNEVSFINKLQSGDEHAFNYAMKAMGLPLRRFLARCYGLSHEDAEDIIIESWMKIYRNVEGFKPRDAKLTTWIFNVVKNTAIDHLRKHARVEHESPLPAGEQHAQGDIKRQPVPHYQLGLDFEAEIIEDRPLILQLRRALDSLSEGARSVLLMRQTLPTKEIAQIENISEAGVRMRYNRALKELRAALEKVMADEG